MKPWNQLTERGKFRRLRTLAAAALANYAVGDYRMRLVGGFANVIYRIDTASATYALRVDYLQDHTDADVAVELDWLASLEDTDLDVCRVIPTVNGGRSVYASGDGIPNPRRCVLFEWIPGKPLAEDMTPDRYEQLGSLAARLHVAGADYQPPSMPMAWDQVFYWQEPIDPVVYHLDEHAHHFVGGRRELLDRAIETVTPAFAQLDPSKAQIIHADLHPWNVHVSRSRMIALDFEDVAWGHRIQDIAITLFYHRNEPGFDELQTAFESGYRAVAQWPLDYEGQIETFVAARTIMFINFMLNLGEDPTEFYDRAFPRLENLLDHIPSTG
ncbi:MAG: phosphotransferase [Acidimicrobiia bacterium]|nr:phosphotransferase [Acidimicrobiia bacterium]MDH5505198.1 phosphotransferase [Acidimicrobiia bacterium]